ncbi:MAG: type II toxin-antitoxin system RelE/ParE family toxin [Prochloraceae cyanobacterium]
MIGSFKDRGTEDVFLGKDTKFARSTCPQTLWKIARRKLDQLNFAISLHDLLVPPGNKLESLKGDRSGQYSIRINDRYRICFTLIDQTFEQVEIVDYH